VQLVTKSQYPCWFGAIFAILVNVKMWGEISVDAGKRSSWQLAIGKTLNRGFAPMIADKNHKRELKRGVADCKKNVFHLIERP